MFKGGFSKQSKAQHIVELALFVPFVIIFIGAVTDIAFAINSNYKFNSSLYEAVNLMAVQNKHNVEEDETVNNIREYTQILMHERHTPYFNNVEVRLVQAGNLAFLVGEYTFTAGFTLLNTFYDFIPSGYNFTTVIPINSAVIKNNPYNIEDDELTQRMERYYEQLASAPAEEESSAEGVEE